MALNIPSITPIPDPPLKTDPANFAQRADEFLGSLPDFVTETNSSITELNKITSGLDQATPIDAWEDDPTSYDFPDVVAGSDGHTYRALDAGIVGVDPTTDDGTNWVTVSAKKATNEQVIAGTSTNTLASPAGLTAHTAARPSGFKNAIINGEPRIWQRGTSFSATTATQYLADRWLNAMTGTTQAVSRQEFTLGQTDVPGEPRYFQRNVVVSVAGAGNQALVMQRIEGVRTFAGQTVTLSFWAKADAGKDIALNIQQQFGSGGSPSDVVSVLAEKITLTTSWQKITKTINMPSIAGKTLGTDGGDYLLLAVWFDAGSNFNGVTDSLGQQSGTFDIAQVQLEAGSIATPFEQRAVGLELQLCQRYYEQGKYQVRINADTNSNAMYSELTFSVPKRVDPTMVSSDETYYGNTISLNYTPTGRSQRSVTVIFQHSGTATSSGAVFNWTADAEL